MLAKKRQNKITEYRKMLQAWKAAGIWTYAGYILGFPGDTCESIAADIEIIKKELPLDILEFFFLTPLPGSEDHKSLWTKGIAMDADLNKYDLEHAVTAHPKMSKAEWEKIYWDAWQLYYTPEHIETIFRRAKASFIDIYRLMVIVLWFAASLRVEKVHPLQGGILRFKNRHERRPELPVESVFAFYPKFAMEFVRKHAQIAREGWRIRSICRRVDRDPSSVHHMDLALTPVTDDDVETLAMFTKTTGGKAAVAHQRKVHELTHAV